MRRSRPTSNRRPHGDLSVVRPFLIVLVLPCLLVSVAPVEADDGIELGEWLLLGPVAQPLPALHDEDERRPVAPEHLLAAETLRHEELWPRSGASLSWPGIGRLTWRGMAAGEKGVALSPIQPGVPHAALLAAYIEVDRFTEARLTITTAHPVRAFLNGVELAEKSSTERIAKDGNAPQGGGQAEESKEGEDAAPEPGEVTAELALATGKHLILLHTVLHPDSNLPWTVHAALAPKEEEGDGASTNPLARFTLAPEHGIRIADLLDVEAVSSLHLSPDGRHLAIRYRKPEVRSEDQAHWLEIVSAEDGERRFSVRGGGAVTAFAWAPQGDRFSYVTRGGDKATIWLGDLATGSVGPLLEEMENLGSHRWAPDGRSLVFARGEEEEKDPTAEAGLIRLRSPQDRWSGWRTKSYLYEVSTADGTLRRLTAGALSTDLQDVHPEGRHLLFSRMVYDLDERPYSRAELFELSLETLEAKSLGRVIWFGSAEYSPRGDRVLVLAGPSAFEGVGSTLPEERIPNDYETQAFLLDRESGEVEPITREFDPALQQAVWSRHDGRIYFLAQVGSAVRLFSYDPARRRFEQIEAGLESLGALAVAENAPRLAVLGSSTTKPPRVRTLDLPSRRAPRDVAVPGRERFERIRLGEVRDWSFTSEAGDEIQGRVHYPLDFDPDRRYPAIVYYYGGVSPVGRSFGGRYPFELWTAHGYVVYVLQPSGAIGYGQEFASRHVNNWGRTVAGEIIEGTEKFLVAHEYVDRERVGCIGASYGGFMTMLLVTETDLYAGCVSHAGISSLSSYWGEGWWGYLYSAVASAGSYPWNRPDIYVDQSPLFRADRITTPLLLLHGTGDTNVPPGESDQIYVALSLLGRDVEYVRIEGEDHWILDYPKRVKWMETILAWFDRQLKDEPEWWEHLYP